MNIKNKLFKRLLLFFSIIITPLLLVIGIWFSADKVYSGWTAFVSLCVKSWNALVGFLIYNDNIWVAIMVGIFLIGLLRGVLFFIQQLWNVRNLHKEFQSKAIVGNYDFSTIDYTIVDDDRMFAVTVGFIKPVIYVSRGLIEGLSKNELHSVIAHEKYHLSNDHPLALLFMNTFRVSLFFIPVIRDLVSYITLRFEFLADQAAIKTTSRNTLALALLKTFEGNRDKRPFPLSTAAFAQGEDRVEAIIDGTARPVLRLSKSLVVISFVVVSFFSFLLFSTQVSEAHSLAGGQLLDNGNMIDGSYCHSVNQSLFFFDGAGMNSELNQSFVWGVSVFDAD